MFGIQRKTKPKKEGTSSARFFGATASQKNPYESFEVEYRQESEIHRRWQRIEDTALLFKRRYEDNPGILEYIDTVRSAEKIFVKGMIKHWNNEQIREELMRNHIEDMSNAGKIDKNFAREIYEAFKTVSVTAVKADEVTRELLEKYAESPAYCAFVLYLRDIYVAYTQSSERGESSEAFKDRLVRIRMEVISGNAHVDISELKNIYEEFKEALRQK